MAKRTKLKRRLEIVNFSNIFTLADLPKKEEEIFSSPLVLELGCGKGAYTLGLARMHPEKNYLGIDVKGERLWRGAKTALQENIKNVFFLHSRVDAVALAFRPLSISEIWVTFPDPFPRKKQAKHRFSSPSFLDMYKKILVPGGFLHIKTDDESFFEYSLDEVYKAGGKVLKAIANIYKQENLDPILQIQTDFEKKHLAKGKKIYYILAEL